MNIDILSATKNRSMSADFSDIKIVHKFVEVIARRAQ